DTVRILILNGDLPIFPGQAGHEYLHTTHLAARAQEVGLVSLVHTAEQDEKKQALVDAGVSLYVWESPHLGQMASDAGPRLPWLRRIGKALYIAVRTGLHRPQDTFIQDLQLANIAGPLLRALGETSWQVLVVVQSKCAHWVDSLPRFPVNVLVLHDVRAMVYERWAQTTPTVARRLGRLVQAWVYRHFERRYCRQYDLVITVSSADEAWVRQHYQPTRLFTVAMPVGRDCVHSLCNTAEVAACVVFTGAMDHPPNVDAG